MELLKFLFLLSCIVCASSTLFCERASLYEYLIVGGHQTSVKKYPFIGAMIKPSICGGSLIRKDYVITAAHCLVNDDSSKIRARDIAMRFGSNCIDREGTVVYIEELEVHPSFSLRTFDYDVGIMKLTRNSAAQLSQNENVKIIPIADENWTLRTGTTAFISGWGVQSEGGSVAKVLQEAEIPILDHQRCKYNYRLIGKVITDSMFCAGNFLGGVDACQGDSGGPIVTMRQGQFYLLGVTSWGMGCGRRNYPGVYAKIPALKNWLLSKMN